MNKESKITTFLDAAVIIIIILAIVTHSPAIVANILSLNSKLESSINRINIESFDDVSQIKRQEVKNTDGWPLISVEFANKHEMFISLRVPDFEPSQVNTGEGIFTLLKIPGASFLGETGKPQLPVFTKLVAVPNTKVSLEIIHANVKEYIPVGKIFPAQKPQIDHSPSEEREFIIDEMFYKSKIDYPLNIVKIVNQGNIRDIPFINVVFCPIQYNPKTELAMIYEEIIIKITWTDDTLLSMEHNFSQSPFYNFYENVFSNWAGFVKNVEFIESKFSSRELRIEPGCEYLIITHPDFSDAANNMSEWKNKKGIVTRVVNTSETGSDNEAIRQYIQNAYDTWNPAPSYVLLLGDAEYIPTNYEDYWLPEPTSVATDLRYATVSGPPDDYFPDIFIGRISVDDLSQANVVVHKIINYERNPPNNNGFYSNVTHAAYFQDYDDSNGYEDRRMIKTSEEIGNYLFTQGYNKKRIYYTETDKNPTHYNDIDFGNGEPLPPELLRMNGFIWDGNHINITDAINNGTLIVGHRGHGAIWGWIQPYYHKSHIQNDLSNNDMLPIVFSMDCNSGAFASNQQECFSEEFLRKANGGAVGVIGSSADSLSGYNDYMDMGFFDAIWPDFDPYNGSGTSLYKMGEILNYGKIYMTQTWGDPWGWEELEFDEFHLFGDPTMEIWSSAPRPLIVEHPDHFVYGPNMLAITVTNETGNPVEGAVVCLFQDEGDYITAYTDAFGSAILHIDATNRDNMTILVTAHNYLPYEETITIGQWSTLHEWPMFRNNPSHAGHSESIASDSSDILWSNITIDDWYSSPVVADGKIYVQNVNDGYLYCFNAEIGDFIWSNYTGSRGVGLNPTPAVVDGRVYIGSDDKNLYCFDALNGEKLWNFTTGHWIYSSPTVADGLVYIGSIDGNLYCLDADPFDDGVDEGIPDGPGVNFDLIWNFTIPTGYWMSSSAAVADGRAYFSSKDGNVYCLDADPFDDGVDEGIPDGPGVNFDLIWNYTTEDYITYSSPAVVDNRVYITSFGYAPTSYGNVYCLNASDGSEIWNYHVGDQDCQVLSSPAVAYGKIYFGSYDRNVYCLDAEGNGDGTTSLIWNYTTGHKVFSSPAVADGKVYIGSEDYSVYCLDAEGDPSQGTTSLIWSYETGARIQSSPAIANEKLYVGSKGIFCFRGNQPPEKPSTPLGSTIGTIDSEYLFSSNTTDPDRDQVYYNFSWGDNNYSGWLGPFFSGEMVYTGYTWTEVGGYDIRVKSKDIYDAESVWSDLLSLQIFLNIVYVDNDRGAEWYDHFHVRTIQEGMNNVSAGGTVFVYSGVYLEQVLIDKAVTLTGQDKDLTIIDGNYSGHVVTITADHVNISGFTIKNSGIGDHGIDISSDYNIIMDNIITDNHNNIYLSDSSSNDITENTVRRVDYVASGLIGYWNMNEGTGGIAYDSSGNQYDGIISGATWVEDGYSGSALSFDGLDDYVDTPLGIDHGSSGVTMMAWVYPISVSGGRHQVISTDEGWFDWSILRENDEWRVFNGDNSMVTDFFVDLYEWQHIAAVFIPAESCVRFYKDGEETVIEGLWYDGSDNNVRFGNNPGGWGEYFDGMIDEVRIYNRDLSGDEIRSLYNGEVGIVLHNSSSNMINENIIANHTGYGVKIIGSSVDNVIYHNNFIGNNNEGDIQAYDESLNFWNDTYPSGGNYWSDHDTYDDYQGVNQLDLGSDGIVDNGTALGGGLNPYNIDGGGNHDWYPLIDPWTPPYTITDLGILGGGNNASYAYSINNDGKVVGSSGEAYGLQNAFLWADGIMTDLGTLGDGLWSKAQSINDADLIVGSSHRQNPSWLVHAFLWENGIMTDLGNLGGNSKSSYAYGINNNGKVIGRSNIEGTQNQPSHAFLWENEIMIDLGNLTGDDGSVAYGINDYDQVVGTSSHSDVEGTHSQAFLWDATSGITPIDTGYDHSEAYDINNLGQVVGYSYGSNGETHAYIWQSGIAVTLGTLGGMKNFAYNLNNSGAVVGSSSYTPGNAAMHAFLWEDGIMYDLNDMIPTNSGWELIKAYDINDNGQIVGYGENPDGNIQAFLLEPVLIN